MTLLTGARWLSASSPNRCERRARPRSTACRNPPWAWPRAWSPKRGARRTMGPSSRKRHFIRYLQRLRSAQTQSQALEAAPAPELRLVRAGRPARVLLRYAVAGDIPLYVPARPQRHRGLRRTGGGGLAVATEARSHRSHRSVRGNGRGVLDDATRGKDLKILRTYAACIRRHRPHRSGRSRVCQFPITAGMKWQNSTSTTGCWIAQKADSSQLRGWQPR